LGSYLLAMDRRFFCYKKKWLNTKQPLKKMIIILKLIS